MKAKLMLCLCLLLAATTMFAAESDSYRCGN